MSKDLRFIEALSQERIKSYDILCPNGSSNELIGAYHWNLLVCGNLYPFIQCAEVALRNSLHDALSIKFQTEEWFDVMELNNKSLHIINKTKDELQAKRKKVNTPDIIASLNFGFWLTLLQHKLYSNQQNPDKIWPELVPIVFPYYGRGNSEVKQISKRFKEIKNLRNRLFHHEPIWKFKDAKTAEQSIVKLRKQFDDILKGIGWISKEKKIYLRDYGFVDTFKKNCDLLMLKKYQDGNIQI